MEVEPARPDEVELTGPIRAAGGVLWRLSTDGAEILLIHRPRYDDWTLPKGKLKVHESWETAALREVLEETGYRASIMSFAGPVTYEVKRQTENRSLLEYAGRG